MTHIKLILGLIFCVLSMQNVSAYTIEDVNTNNPTPSFLETVSDTIPVEERYDDFINDPTTNPFDIFPSELEQKVEYDPESNQYIIYEKIGDEFFRTPTYMTFDEYIEWNAQQEQKSYFEKLSGIGSGDRGRSGLVDPMSKINVEKFLIDKLFGGNGVTIKPQGSIDITLGMDYQNINNPSIPENSQRNYGMVFDEDIQINVDGNIGDKLDLGFNYNTNATFDFDRKIKLAYDSEKFTEDDILKKIEAGNVSLPLRSSLIEGAQSLFGIKTELQFGHLKLTAIASQQRSKQKEINIQNGATVQEFEIRPDDYDENRHFFISHYHRDAYEEALSNLPQIKNTFRVANIEIWISDDKPNYQQNSTKVVAIADLGESDASKFDDPTADYEPTMGLPSIYEDSKGRILPDNEVNTLYEELEGDLMTRQSEFVNTNLAGPQYNLTQTVGYEVFKGRKLQPSEFTFNAELGFVSLNIRLKPNQVLGIAYQYYYTQNCNEVYKVGEMSPDALSSNGGPDGEVETESVIFVKMLKSTNQRPLSNMWDLMMKNVYPLRTSQLQQEDFVFDIFYEDDFNAKLKKFLPVDGLEDFPLLNVFNLDRLNSRNDPQPDGIFDFAPGITVIPRNGVIVFPVLEPFGQTLLNLKSQVPFPAQIDTLAFTELYDEALVKAQEKLHKNKFVMVGKYKSDISSEISLGAWNIPQGSVRVYAGGRLLDEGSDYEIEYGIGRLRILNEALLTQGVPLRVEFEDNSVFSLQQKTLFGLRADYEVNKKMAIGGTYLRLSEKPFTEKVNIGDDPIRNSIYGLDMVYNTPTPWMTKMLDALPLYSTNAESSLNVVAEVAALRPGHSNAVNLSDDNGGVVNIDDFEGAVSGLPLGTQPNRWLLASTPSDKPGYGQGIASGYNRAWMSWYVIDRFSRDDDDLPNPYSRIVNQKDLFPNRDIPPGQLPELRTFDLTFYPNLRGPYNYDPPTGEPGISSGIERYDEQQEELILANPESRWAGVMRYMNNSDFQAANYEYIDFWMLNPFIGSADQDTGKLVFHLGNISEDINADNVQLFESAIPVDGETQVLIKDTEFGRIPLDLPTNPNAFDNDNRDAQDLGFDGLSSANEADYFKNYVDAIQAVYPANLSDASNDDFIYFGNPSIASDPNLLNRYKRFNGPEGNAPDGSQNERGNPYPDREDLNENSSLDQGESYYQYTIDLIPDGDSLDRAETPFIRDVRKVGDDGQLWYRFQIPIQEVTAENVDVINGIQGFRSIQFMRMLVEGFKTQKTFRLAEFELVRSQWRTFDPLCFTDAGAPEDLEFSLDVVSLQENSEKQPFNYALPRGIKEERLISNLATINQDERSMSLNFCNVLDSCELSMFKLSELDLRVYEKFQLFVHAEQALENSADFNDGDFVLFVRFGKDFQTNYYEYEIPLVMSEEGVPASSGTADNTGDVVWRTENMMDLRLKDLTDLKLARNALQQPVSEKFSQSATINPDHNIGIIGNPNLGFVKGIQIGVRKVVDNDKSYCGEVWVNELRTAGFDERGGVAALARVDWQLADLGNVTLSGKYNSIGYGGLDQKLNDRSKEEVIQYDAAANVELGKLLPKSWNMRIPMYTQYAKEIRNPLFDPFDLDLTLEEKLANNPDPAVQDVIKEEAQEVLTIKTINFINVKKEKGKPTSTKSPSSSGPSKQKDLKDKIATQQKPEKVKKVRNYPWNISNFSVSYSYTETDRRTPLLAFDNTKDYMAGLDYKYAPKVKYIQPFKSVSSKYLKFIKEFNFNPLPNSFAFSTDMNRQYTTRRFRLPSLPVFEFDEKFFNWERRYDLNWDFAKSLKFKFSAMNESFIDEYRQVGLKADPAERDWVDEVGDTVLVGREQAEAQEYWMGNVREGGRNTNYNHQAQLSYNVPLKNFPFLGWVNVKAQYKTDYAWISGPLIEIDEIGTLPGAIIQNGQNRSLTADFNFDKIWSKSKYYKKLNKVKSKSKRGKDGKKEAKEKPKPKTKEERKKSKKDRPITLAEKILVRPLFLMKKVKFSYKEDFDTSIPGFMPEAELLGLSNGFNAPGWDFIAGAQPNLTVGDSNNWLNRAASNNWMNASAAHNNQLQQGRQQTLDLGITLEPWKDLDIDIDFKKKFSYTNREEFRYKNEQWLQLGQIQNGSFDMTYFAMNTLFNDSKSTFNNFMDNRVPAANIVAANAVGNPNVNENHTNDPEFPFGFGPTSNKVLIPAFIAAYTNGDAEKVAEVDFVNGTRNLNFNEQFLLPKPNWKVKYDGLNKLPWFKDYISNFSVEHGYKSTLSVSNYNLNPEYNSLATSEDPLETIYSETGPPKNANYFTRWIIPDVKISEQFAPVLGINLKTKSDYTLGAEYRKSRDLILSVDVGELIETSSSEIIFDVGTILKDINIGFLTGDRKGKGKKRASSSKAKELIDNVTKGSGNRGVNDKKARTLELKLAFSYRDDETRIHDLNKDKLNAYDSDAQRGTTSYILSPSAEYAINKSLAIRWYLDYNKTTPKVSSSFPRTTFESGFVVRFKLQ